MEGHIKLATNIKEQGSLGVIQLHHAGMRSPAALVNERPVCPCDNEKTSARGLTLEEVGQLRDDFIAAALRAKKCGYDGVEVHGAHGYILTQFLSSEINKRTDEYGGSLLNRARLLFEIVEGISAECGKGFLLGVRLSPEKNGMDIQEVKFISQQLIDNNLIDFLDLSLWDCFKKPEDDNYQDASLLEHFTSLNLKNVLLTVAGKIRSGKDVSKILNSGVDFVSIGRSGILHHDFQIKVIKNSDFETIETPVSEDYLFNEGLSKNFIKYMSGWPGFVEQDS
jgi:2,4-dienoyl-CoA reductase-like NADH-dependent reductase (Old Yellow Enzyme family)